MRDPAEYQHALLELIERAAAARKLRVVNCLDRLTGAQVFILSVEAQIAGTGRVDMLPLAEVVVERDARRRYVPVDDYGLACRIAKEGLH